MNEIIYLVIEMMEAVKLEYGNIAEVKMKTEFGYLFLFIGRSSETLVSCNLSHASGT